MWALTHYATSPPLSSPDFQFITGTHTYKKTFFFEFCLWNAGPCYDKISFFGVFLFWCHLLIHFCSSFSLTPHVKFAGTPVPTWSLLSGCGILRSKCALLLSLSYQPVLRVNPKSSVPTMTFPQTWRRQAYMRELSRKHLKKNDHRNSIKSKQRPSM